MSSRPLTPADSPLPPRVDTILTGSRSLHSFGRRSLGSPLTPLSSRGMHAPSSANGFSRFESADNGLGNLADELAEIWDEDEGLGEGPSELYADNIDQLPETPSKGKKLFWENSRDSGIDVASSPAPFPSPLGHSSPAEEAPKHTHRRNQSNYATLKGEQDNNLELRTTMRELETQMAAVESLAKGAATDVDGTSDESITRVIEQLRNLGAQSGIETGASRLITAHTALSSALANQTRTLHSLSHPFLSPLSQPMDPEALDELLPLIASSISLIPRPSSTTLACFRQLTSTSRELIHALKYLADTLQMTRQTTNTATRRLKSARELVAELEKETKASEMAVRWIEQGNWQRRLADRECARVCRDTVTEIEEVYNGWRERLLASAARNSAVTAA